MKITTITYQRVINLGNYESKRLEMTAEIGEDDNIAYAPGNLMEMVEQAVRQNKESEILAHIEQLEAQKNKLRQEISHLQEKLGELKNQQELTEVKQRDDDLLFDPENKSELIIQTYEEGEKYSDDDF